MENKQLVKNRPYRRKEGIRRDAQRAFGNKILPYDDTSVPGALFDGRTASCKYTGSMRPG